MTDVTQAAAGSPVVPSTFDSAFALLQTFLASVDAKQAAQAAQIAALQATQIDPAKIDALLATINAASDRLAAL